MEQEGVKRKLTTILAADVEGYTRLMRADEEATLKTLGEYREIIDGLVARHDGRVFSTGGDSVLAEFGSTVEAVRCAISCQEEISSRNAELADERKLMFRIGINVGDVMVRDGDLFGDGVNVAARLEGLAEAGGVCISGSVFEQIKHKLSLGFEDMGQQEVKNIAEPVSAYRLVPGQVSVSAGATAAAKPAGARHWRMPAIAAAVVVIIAAGGLAVWQPWAPTAKPVPQEDTVLPRPDKPSIAVLPFKNMSGDPEQEYFADGMTEDLITDLAKISGLVVVARNSTFAYKGQSPDVREVARQLDVRYVVEGSVRKAGGRIRINAQLIDAETGAHLWAERYDREATDVFELQDEVRARIVAALRVKLTPAEESRLAHQLTSNPEAYDYWLRGLRQVSFFTKQGNAESRRLFERALELDPGFAAALATLATSYSLAAENGWSSAPTDSMAEARVLAEKAVALDEDLPLARWVLGRVLSRRQHFDGDRAIAELQKAIALDPNYADAYALLANVLVFVGRAEEALAQIERAMRLNPHFPFWYFYVRGISQFHLTRYDAAAEDLRKAIERNPTAPWPHRFLAATYGQLGMKDEAEWELEELRALGYDPTIATVRRTINIVSPAYLELYLNGLRKAGVPE
jgi:adenylate cyclase